jgi:hypothetical protein
MVDVLLRTFSTRLARAHSASRRTIGIALNQFFTILAPETGE